MAVPGANLMPMLASIATTWKWSGAANADLTVLVTGNGFAPVALMYFDGQPRPTKYLSATQLRVMIYGSDLLWPCSCGVMVRNPAPGGGESNALTFLAAPIKYRVYTPFVRR